MSKYKPTKEQKHAEYLRHRDKYIARAKKWTAENPNKRREISLRDNTKRCELKKKWWQKTRFGTLVEMGECRRCGSDTQLVVHHSDGNNGKMGKPLNNDIDNLVVLCRSCHAKIHRHGVILEVV